MSEVTPRQVAPAHVRRQSLVDDAMAALEGVEQLPLAEQLTRLEEAQAVLARVLDNPDEAQRPIPGVGARQ